MSETCGYAITDADGIEQPCDRPVEGWRWYQDVEHEDTLEQACNWHMNEGGRRLHAAEAEVERLARECLDREATETDARERLQRAEERLAAVEALAENWDGFLANRGDEMSHAQKHAWTTALDELRAALRKPGGGRP